MDAMTESPTTDITPASIQVGGIAIATEVPVALVYNGISHVVMMATPVDLPDFALGFSLSEGIVASAAEVRDLVVQPCEAGIEVAITIPPRRFAALKERQRNLVGRTGCGLCGVAALADAVRPARPVAVGSTITRAALEAALAHLRDHQPLNAGVHALHAAGWASRDGQIRLSREDVGRHNALDKLIGAMAARNLDFADGFLVITSRCSVEMVQKAAALGVTILVAVSAPTSLAVDLAQRAGMTLIAAAGPGQKLAFSHPHRLV